MNAIHTLPRKPFRWYSGTTCLEMLPASRHCQVWAVGPIVLNRYPEDDNGRRIAGPPVREPAPRGCWSQSWQEFSDPKLSGGYWAVSVHLDVTITRRVASFQRNTGNRR